MAAGLAKDAAGNVEGYEIFIKYLPYDTQEDALASYFSECGDIVGKPRLMRHAQSGQCKGIGWITFATQEALTEALRWEYNLKCADLTDKASHWWIEKKPKLPPDVFAQIFTVAQRILTYLLLYRNF